MPAESSKRVFRKSKVSAAEAERLNTIRRRAMKDFPPDPGRPRPAKTGIGAQIRAARKAKGLTWYAVAKLAGIPNPATIRDIEFGRDAYLTPTLLVADPPREDPTYTVL